MHHVAFIVIKIIYISSDTSSLYILDDTNISALILKQNKDFRIYLIPLSTVAINNNVDLSMYH